MPKVSVIIPTHNTARHIAEAIESVLAQTYQDYEIIVVDDGSTDNTPEVIAPYRDQIRYVWQASQERAVARNHGLHLAQGELIAFLDSDDIWLPDKLERQVAALDRYNQAVLVYGPAKIIDIEGQPSHFWGSAYLCGEPGGEIEVNCPGREMLFGSPIMPSVVLARREALEQAGPFDTEVIPAEDWDMWLRLAQLGAFVWLPQVLAYYRTPGSERERRRRISDPILARTVLVIQKMATAYPEKFPAVVRDQALASVYVDSALASYESGDTERGQKILTQAIQLDPTLAEPGPIFFRLEDYARRLLRDTGDETKVIVFLSAVIHNLPSAVPASRSSARSILSRVHMADAFRAHTNGDKITLRQSLWFGVRYDPRWLLNRGVLSMLVRSFWQ